MFLSFGTSYFYSMNKWSFLIFLFPFTLQAQTVSEYSVVLEPVSVPQFPGIQSAATAYDGEEVLLIGGRLDGLHRRQPFASFDAAGHNDQLLVVNLQTKMLWKFPVSKLPVDLRDQLKATNHCYTQVKDTIYLVGGYGISEKAGGHVTFRSGIKFSVPDVIRQVKNNAVDPSVFNQVTDSLFGETGGQLEMMDGIFYLVGGHLFDGRYNPRNGPSFTQTYSSEVRKFKWNTPQPEWLEIIRDEALLHKRDYNLVRIQTGEPALIAFSGVFQKNVDLPFQQATRITGQGKPVEVDHFRQFYNHYECPELVIFNPEKAESDVIFLGGIAQFYDSLGVLVQDNNVPFVETISRVHVNPDGSMNEYLVPAVMPPRYGAGVSFVPSKHPNWDRKLFVWKAAMEDTLEMGYLLGGISTVARNVFWIHEGAESAALNVIYRVKLVKTGEPHKRLSQANNPVQLQVLENSKSHRMYLAFNLPEKDEVSLNIFNENGDCLIRKRKMHKAGKQTWNQFPKYIGWYKVNVSFSKHPEWNWEQWVFYE